MLCQGLRLDDNEKSYGTLNMFCFFSERIRECFIRTKFHDATGFIIYFSCGLEGCDSLESIMVFRVVKNEFLGRWVGEGEDKFTGVFKFAFSDKLLSTINLIDLLHSLNFFEMKLFIDE